MHWTRRAVDNQTNFKKKLERKAFGQSEIFVLIIVHLFLAGRQGEKDGDDEDH